MLKALSVRAQFKVHHVAILPLEGRGCPRVSEKRRGRPVHRRNDF